MNNTLIELTKVIFSILSATTALTLLWIKPFKIFNQKDFIFFKKEASLKIDGNEAIDQIFKILTKPDLSTNSFRLNQPVTEFLSKNSSLSTKLQTDVTNLEHAIINLSNINFYLTASLIAATFFGIFYAYRYFNLKRKFKKLAQTVNSSVQGQKKLLQSVQAHKINFKNNNQRAIRVKNKLEKLNKNLILFRKNKSNAELLEKINTNHRNLAKAAIVATTNSLHETKKKFNEKTFKASENKILSLYEKLIKTRNFDNSKFKPSHLIFSGVTLILVYYLIELGMTEAFQDNFVEAMSRENFVTSTHQTCLSIKDFERLDKKLYFPTTSTDDYFKRSHTAPLATIKMIYNS